MVIIRSWNLGMNSYQTRCSHPLHCISRKGIGSVTSSENSHRYSKLHRINSWSFIALLTLVETHIHAAPATSAGYWSGTSELNKHSNIGTGGHFCPELRNVRLVWDYSEVFKCNCWSRILFRFIYPRFLWRRFHVLAIPPGRFKQLVLILCFRAS